MINCLQRITQGSTVDENISYVNYPAGTWSLRVVFVIDDQQTIINATQVGTTNQFNIRLPKETTAAMNAGKHFYQAFVTDGTDRFKVDEGETQVVADFETKTTGYDARSILRRQVEAIRSLLMGIATNEQKKVKYLDREIEKYDRADLISVYHFLKSELKAEENQIAMTDGRPFGGRIRVKF